MAKKYTYKLEKHLTYFVNQEWITDSYFCIKRHLLNTNSELLNSKLQTNESLQYNINNGGIVDGKIPDLDAIMKTTASVLSYQNELVNTHLRTDQHLKDCTIYCNPVKNYLTYIDTKYIKLFESIASEQEKTLTFYSNDRLASTVACFNNDVIGLIMPVSANTPHLPSDLVIVHSYDVKDVKDLQTITL